MGSMMQRLHENATDKPGGPNMHDPPISGDPVALWAHKRIVELETWINFHARHTVLVRAPSCAMVGTIARNALAGYEN